MLRFASFAFVLLTALSARADVFVIPPPYFTGTDGEKVSEDIVGIVREELRSQHKIIEPMAAAALVKKEERVWCKDANCAERYRDAAGAVAAINIRVRRFGSGSGPATSFQLGIQPAPGIEYAKEALLSDGPLKDLVVRAIRDAFREYRQGPGPWLEITGAPEGAAIYLDGKEVGTLPRTLAVPVGQHSIRIEARTFVPKSEAVTLLSPTDRKKIEVRLEPELAAHGGPSVTEWTSAPQTREPGTTPAMGGRDERADAERRRARWVRSGSVTAAVGLALIVTGAVYKAREGDCANRYESSCTDRYDVRAYSKALLASGVVATGLGAALIATGMTRYKRKWSMGADVRPNAVHATVQGAF